jgi:hypothetical protein
MYETDIFVKCKFRFIGMQIFITNEAQIVITPSHTKSTQTYTRSIKMNFLTLSGVKRAAPPWLILLHANCLQNLYSHRQIFICQNSRHPKSTAKTQILIMGYIFTYVAFEILHFLPISQIVSHSSLSITSFLQHRYYRNIVFLEDHPLNCPFYPKMFYAT